MTQGITYADLKPLVPEVSGFAQNYVAGGTSTGWKELKDLTQDRRPIAYNLNPGHLAALNSFAFQCASLPTAHAVGYRWAVGFADWLSRSAGGGNSQAKSITGRQFLANLIQQNS